MQIIIPMSGQGERFKKSGYKDLKPLIKIHGKTIIEHIIDKFPGEKDFIFICNEEHLEISEMKSILQKAAPECTIISIKPHKLGPVYAVLQASEYINDNEPVIVNYCDFNWEWDFDNFKKITQEKDVDGSVVCYKNFHPHLLGPNLYASVNTDENNYMLEIKEKYSFTPDKMDSWQSSGTYYFKKGEYVKKYFNEIMKTAITINNEYYVSMVFNFLYQDKLRISVYPISYFCQWGTPEDFEEYKYFADYFINDKLKKNHSIIKDLQIVVPMAGEGKRFKEEGFITAKPLIIIDDKPMVVQAIKSLPQGENYFFVVRKEHIKYDNIDKILRNEFNIELILSVSETTQGQASTCLLAKSYLNLDKPLLIGACDNAVVMDYNSFKDLINSDAQVIPFVFKNYFNANRNPNMYGWVKIKENGEVDYVSVKKPISNNIKEDFGIVGAFYFKKAEYFIKASEDMIRKNIRVNNEFYVDSLINNAVELGYKTRIFEINKYICWGTPFDLKSYEYWREYHKIKRYNI